MLDTLLCLDLGIDSGSRSSYGIVSLIIGTRTLNLPAAAAGSEELRLAEAEAGLLEARASGLLLRRGSLTAGGDRERRSNLDVRFGSGSFWSKRERLTARRSVSSISNIKSKTRKEGKDARRRVVTDRAQGGW